MPRLPASLLRHAHAIDPLLPLLLRVCRDLPSARNELRWLREHAAANANTTSANTSARTKPINLDHLCLERSRGKPLQYILGNQPFGEVDILCKPGVLIPRPETESYTSHLAHLLLPNNNKYAPLFPPTPRSPPFRILDLCTGTGCIPLLLHALLSPPNQHPASPQLPLSLTGVDISPKAISLATKNLHWNIKHGHLAHSAAEQVRFVTGDILCDDDTARDFANHDGQQRNFDILISNPPYISPGAFATTTARSVRNYEPRLALVPPPPPKYTRARDPSGINAESIEGATARAIDAGDVFYPQLLATAKAVNAKIALFEVADLAQAERVMSMVWRSGGWDGGDIWRDWLGGRSGEEEFVLIEGKRVGVVGEGNGRAVVCWRGGAGRWIGRG